MMTMYNDDELISMGIDLDGALQRFLGKKAIFEKMLKKLPKAVADCPVEEYFEKKDYQTAFANAHTLKGLAGNLSVTPMFDAYSDICDKLRHEDNEGAYTALKNVLPVQEKIIAYIADNAD